MSSKKSQAESKDSKVSYIEQRFNDPEVINRLVKAVESICSFGERTKRDGEKYEGVILASKDKCLAWISDKSHAEVLKDLFLLAVEMNDSDWSDSSKMSHSALYEVCNRLFKQQAKLNPSSGASSEGGWKAPKNMADASAKVAGCDLVINDKASPAEVVKAAQEKRAKYMEWIKDHL